MRYRSQLLFALDFNQFLSVRSRPGFWPSHLMNPDNSSARLATRRLLVVAALVYG